MSNHKPIFNKKFLTDIGYSSLILVSAAIFVFLYNRNISQRLPPAEFAIFTMLMSIVYLIQVFATAIQNIFTKIVAKHQNKNLSHFRNITHFKFLLLSLLISTIILLVRKQLAQYLSLQTNHINVLVLPVIMGILAFIPRGFLLGQQKIKLSNTIVALEALPIYLASFYINSATDAIIIYSIPTILLNLVSISMIKFDNSQPAYTPPRIQWREYFFVISTLLLIHVPFTFDIFLVPEILKPSYSAISLLGKAIFFASSVITVIMFADISQKQPIARQKKVLFSSLILTFLMGGTMSLIYYFAGETIAQMIFKERLVNYQNIVPLMALYGLAMTFFALAFGLANYLIVMNKRKQIGLILLAIFIQKYLLHTYNNSLKDLVLDQLVVYSVLLILLGSYTYYTVVRLKGRVY